MMPTPVVFSDLDGTLYVGDELVPGAPEAVTRLRNMGCTLRFLTNTDTVPPQTLQETLRERGFDVRVGEVFTPVSAALQLFEATRGRINVLPVVSSALLPTFAPYRHAGGAITHVVVGNTHDTLTHQLLDLAFRALERGATLIALQRGKYRKRPDGNHIDTGAITAALEHATGVTSKLLGKPSPEFLRSAAASVPVKPNALWLIGDQPANDIAMGNAVGAHTIQVRTGMYADQIDLTQTHPAETTLDSIVDMPAWLTRNEHQH
ncbi:hypothetical protein B4U45_26175 [Mycobacterium persicum]|uniref:Sugar-phosphatase AraL n=3 Tax=Mycobacteriaceae TaxID=1762 RepID=A0A8E2IWY6_9MYCO|nr:MULTISPECIES: HAD hydrolase-like protein [Mycobacteriaceae]ARV82774.1 hypothetical protein BWK49_16875 [Mycobacterium intracellulare subsp. chimaera]MBN7483525.1 HAD hydrolase-like protein [Mycobacteroides abscessus subsp. massiliense]OKH75497.1 hypothetical protein EB74_25700 [Mycobacterium sp. SWH-M5]RUP00815.1 MAG: TIGR01458 family HAD-type hydrolase [Mycobacterium sp.]SLI27116.1 HAD family hydrolase [Mycobacteroides abscessus subsp. abscessus]BBZ83683.1 haloacid dehalogenase [Mycobacte